MHVGFPRDTASVNSVTCLSWPQRVEQSTKGTRRAELGNALGRHERTRRRIIVVLYQQVPLSALIPPPCLSSPLSLCLYVCLSVCLCGCAGVYARRIGRTRYSERRIPESLPWRRARAFSAVVVDVFLARYGRRKIRTCQKTGLRKIPLHGTRSAATIYPINILPAVCQL